VSWDVSAVIECKGVISTGSACTLGLPVAKAFASAGARVAVCDLKLSGSEGVVAELTGDQHIAFGLDVTDEDSRQHLVDETVRSFGGVYALVHLAAVLKRRSSIDDVTNEDWDFQIDTNLKASFFLMRSAANAIRETGEGGRIIAFSSQGWWTGGYGGSVVYNTSKGGIVTMVRGLARTFGPDGITVNAIAPGLIDTPMLHRDLEPDRHRHLVRATPLGRLGTPSELAGTAVFLASQHASFVTGATINVSGGFLMY